jgi:hypothetical protein
MVYIEFKFLQSGERRIMMSKERSVVPGLPGIAFATLPTTGETIAIRYGERLYYRVNSTKTADELNVIYGITPDQAQALLASVMSNWNTTNEPKRSDAA